jgi:hypothetical protein
MAGSCYSSDVFHPSYLSHRFKEGGRSGGVERTARVSEVLPVVASEGNP